VLESVFELQISRAHGALNIPEMKPAASFALVLVTAPDLKTARALAGAALQSRLIACANLVPKIQSHYRWRGKIESGREVLLLLKTKKSKLAALEKLILARHPYDTPEFLVLPLSAGSKKYLGWLEDVLKQVGRGY
jgi:periplasmic divalent cation tolerance protein